MALLFLTLGILIGSEVLDLFGIYQGYGWSSLFMSLDLTFGPLVWLSTLFFINKNREFKLVDLLHFISFIVALIWLNNQTVKQNLNQFDGHINDMMAIFVFFKLLLIGIYLTFLHKKLIQFTNANSSEKVFIRCMIWSFTIVFIISYGVFFIMYFGFSVIIDSDHLACILTTFVVYLLTFLILRNPAIFFQRRLFGPKYSNSNLSYENRKLLLDQLESQLNDKQIFLKTDLTLADLAKKLDVSTNVLSQVINEGLNKKFNDLINEHRVEFMKQKLLDPKESHKKILALAFESGFQSKASFNRIFKKISGTTPVQFKLANRSHPTE